MPYRCRRQSPGRTLVSMGSMPAKPGVPMMARMRVMPGMPALQARPVMRRMRPVFMPALLLVLLALILASCGGSSPPAGGAAAGTGQNAAGSGEALPEVVRLDYAYYSPISLVLRELGWMEEAFARDGVEVEWVLSLGSNKANEHLASHTVDFASTAGSAALMARANGVPLQTVFIYGQPEWTALVAAAGSDIDEVADLRGRRIAATRGTDPYFFLLRSLDAAGLSQDDVEIVHLQHPDGMTALTAGQVDAWAGLDPHMAQAELDAGARLFYRRHAWNTYGFLNALESYAQQYPHVVERVLRVYERGRRWVLEHPEDTIRILSEASGVTPEVARRVLEERYAFPSPVPGEEQEEALRGILSILRKEELVPADVDLEETLADLLEPSFAQRALQDLEAEAQ